LAAPVGCAPPSPRIRDTPVNEYADYWVLHVGHEKG